MPKDIGESWIEYLDSIHLDASTETIQTLKHAFYSGVAAMMFIIKDNDFSDNEEKAEKYRQHIIDEVLVYFDVKKEE